MQELLPRLWSGRVAEQGIVVAAPQPIVPRADIHAPALRKFVGRRQFGEDDRVVRQGWPDHPISAVDQGGHELLQSRGVDHRTGHGPYRAPTGETMHSLWVPRMSDKG